jgi:hypothetical protein
MTAIVPALELKRLSPPFIPHLNAFLSVVLYPKQWADGKLEDQDLARRRNRVILASWTLAHHARHLLQRILAQIKS